MSVALQRSLARAVGLMTDRPQTRAVVPTGCIGRRNAPVVVLVEVQIRRQSVGAATASGRSMLAAARGNAAASPAKSWRTASSWASAAMAIRP